MASWQRRLAPLIHAVEQRFDAAKYGLRRALGGPGPLHIEAYRGYGTTTELHLKGRVLEDRGIEPPGEQQSAWKNFRDMLKRVDSREQPYARLLARFRGVEQEIQADEEGMFEVTLRLSEPLEEDGGWHPVELVLLEPRPRGRVEPPVGQGQVLVPPRTARFGVISDIDDTVVQTGWLEALTQPLCGPESVAITAMRPTNSGIMPYSIRSSGCTRARTSPRCFSASPAGFTPKPTRFCPRRRAMISSRPWNAPPQTKRILVASTDRYS